MVQWTGKQLDGFSKKLNKQPPDDSATALPGIYPRKMKTYVHTKPCTWMFVAALFVIAKNWKEPRCSSTGDWLNKLVHSDQGTVLSNKEEWTIHTCDKLDGSPENYAVWRSQSQKITHCMIPLTEHSWNRWTDERLPGPREGWGQGGRVCAFKGCRRDLCADRSDLYR